VRRISLELCWGFGKCDALFPFILSLHFIQLLPASTLLRGASMMEAMPLLHSGSEPDRYGN
jgi:hypothetical protein